jgi:hypothetical protein
MFDFDRLFGLRGAPPQADQTDKAGQPDKAGQAEKAGQPGSLFPELEAAGHADSPSDTGHQTTAPTSRPSPPGDPAADDQPRALAEATGQAQQEGDLADAEAPAATPQAGQDDAQAASGGDLDPQRLWLRAIDELAGELPPAVLEGLRDATARWGGTKPPGPRSYDLRCRCGSAAWNLTVLLRPPHYGYAVRAVCGRCRKVLGLLWWEGGPGNLADDPPHRGELTAGS